MRKIKQKCGQDIVFAGYMSRTNHAHYQYADLLCACRGDDNFSRRTITKIGVVMKVNSGIRLEIRWQSNYFHTNVQNRKLCDSSHQLIKHQINSHKLC
jgi:hypothetical protein